MMAVTVVLVVLAQLVLGAHVLRAGHTELAVALALSPLLLLVRRSWAPRALQVVLAVGTLEWLRTIDLLVRWRLAEGVPYVRMAVILGAVALVTALATLALQTPATRWRRTRA